MTSFRNTLSEARRKIRPLERLLSGAGLGEGIPQKRNSMDAPASPTPRRGFRRYLLDALLLLVLLALTLKLGYHISAVRDLGTDDETNYLAHGHYLAKWGLPE